MDTLARFARRYMAPYLWWYLAGTVALLITNWLSVSIPVVLAQGIDALGPGGEATVAAKAITIAVMGAVIIVVRTLSRVLFFTPGRLVEAQVKVDLFARVLRQQPSFLSQWPTGDLMSRASSDVTFVRLLAGFGALAVVNIVLAVGLTAVQMIRLSPVLALWVLIPIAIGLAFTQLFIRRLFALVHKMQAEAAELSDHVLSSYQGVATVHAFGAEGSFLRRFDDVNERYLGTTKKRADMRAAIAPTLGLAAAVNVFLLLFVGGQMAIRGTLSVGELVAFTTLVAFLTGPLRGVSFLLSMIKQAQAALERIEAVVAPAPERPDLPDPAPAPDTPPSLVFRDLTFSYPDGADVLHGVNLSVPAGATLGILGPTGGGKTTLLRCLARLYNPPPGMVLVDGVDIRDIDLDAWRERVAYVPQRAFLFSESLRDNVLMGVSDDGRLEDVLALAAMDVDLEALPQGVDTEVGESGLMLSGGQRQRTALARGLVRPHVVLILDDVLSAVDHETEQQLIRAMRNAGDQPPTTLIVSHRISALQHADHIAVFRHGRVVEQGTHDELLAHPGLYRATWDRQREGEER